MRVIEPWPKNLNKKNEKQRVAGPWAKLLIRHARISPGTTKYRVMFRAPYLSTPLPTMKIRHPEVVVAVAYRVPIKLSLKPNSDVWLGFQF